MLKDKKRLTFEKTDVETLSTEKKSSTRRRPVHKKNMVPGSPGHDHGTAGKSPPADTLSVEEDHTSVDNVPSEKTESGRKSSTDMKTRLKKRRRTSQRKKSDISQNNSETAPTRKAAAERFRRTRTTRESIQSDLTSENTADGNRKGDTPKDSRRRRSARSDRQMKNRERLHSRFEDLGDQHAGVRFYDEDELSETRSEEDELKKNKKDVRRMQRKRKKSDMRQRMARTSDDTLPDIARTHKEKERTVFPSSGRRGWLALIFATVVFFMFIGSAVSSISLIGSGVIGGASSVLADNHSSMYAGSAIRQEIVSYAESFIGRGKYVWGGNDLGTPENPGSGTDCSGFVQQVFAKFGISLPRTSYDDANAGVEVDYSEARPGDIIVYEGHVAIYAGDGQIVQAANEELDMCMGNALYAPIKTVRNVIPEEMELSYSGDPVELDEESKHLLATMVYHESGNQSYESKVAIAAEVLNRVKSPHFPNTVYEVLNQKNQYCNTDTEPAFRRMYNSTLPDECWQAVEDAMNGADPTGGMCFHCTNDYWNSHYAGLGWPCLVIDDQTFHNWGYEAGYFANH